MAKRLGKGLDALIPSLHVEENDLIVEVPHAEIRPNPYQPRKDFDEKALDELAESIKEHGVIQPLIVRKSIKGYELVAGERRLRASERAGLKKVPVVVREFSNEQIMEIALIENLQRENLNAIEVALAYEKLMKHLSLTQEELAKKVGKSRPHVANFLRLMHLPQEIQDYVSRGTLSMGHARALLGLEDNALRKKVAQEVIKKDLSVRQVEEMIKTLSQPVSRETKEKPKRDVFLSQFEERLRDTFATSVQIKKGKNKGKIEIEFYTNDDLERIMEIIQKG
ncbi:ParB/RepB/Spo0J family partition protein [Ammoniphilus sp. CFH 90114]|uniref:ParB/RepB/Spo0J family partition protein n=1 Tax=Ammoniphilus sp. CFH 90114 TaxID=2493665 RepID=UPI00100E3280|nr:ParB/RepB/Spo0J family partition protein [Ammoniphilus sp. CFH 90114]RXT08889.1 ParB/RepB/Spo0J family partition protein [Ammoniphilus sp. CFH 90114]